VYVHIPFCDRVCPYCDFAVEATGRLDAPLERSYVDLLLRELDLTRAMFGGHLDGRPLATVYFGGGTPSLLGAESIRRLLRRLSEIFQGEPDEVTLEMNPGVLDFGRVPDFRAAGVTRLSVGLQSLHDLTLKRLGRAHRAAEALRGLESGMAAGFRSVSVDLIHGAPDQTQEDLLSDIRRVIGLGIPHVSAYALTVEPGTPFARAQARGSLRLPSEEDAVGMGCALRSCLVEAGYAHYEISNFSRPGHGSRHNQRYWLRQDVLGLGVSAASLLGRVRFQNVSSRSLWQTGLQAGRRVLANSAILSEADERCETLFLGFRRLEGISRKAYQQRFGLSPEHDFRAELEALHRQDLVAETEDRIHLTERGILFADEVFQQFLGR
jgi:oxygen-independent coproporphyrinogen-3 oxidase